jgi:uncharacterized membrane protein YccC
VPVITFIVIGSAREELRTGWALMLWPVLIAVVSTYLLAAKVFIVDRFVEDTRKSSLGLLVGLGAGALVLALVVPQLLE